ncbi:MAG: hypothetical protein VW268_04295 [Rhodospirillaceae bacterium]
MAAAGSGAPALIFRHLAVYPGSIDWVWRAVGPEAHRGWPRQMIWDLLDRTPPVAIAPISPALLAETGVDAQARETIGHMLGSYNSMNPVNLVLIGGARTMLDPAFKAGDQFNVPAEVPDPPPPPTVASLPADIQTLFRDLCRTIPDTGAETTPTMYRHFAFWPDFMRAVGGRLLAQMAALHQATLDFGKAAEPLARAMGARAADPGLMPDVPDMALLLKTLDGFLYVIPPMIVVGKAIDDALPVNE